MKHLLVWNNNPNPVTYLVRDASLTVAGLLPLLLQGLHADLLFERKVTDRQLGGEYVLPLTILRMLAVGCRILFYPINAFPNCVGFAHRAFQDDDYLILPGVIQTLHTRVTEREWPSAVYPPPPHERLSSDLRAVNTHNRTLHTSFSWLGYGTMMHRSLASELLLLFVLNVPNEEVKIADNYFWVLRNHPPETWFDQGIELGGGHAFTVGYEGHEGSKKYIGRLSPLLGGVSSAYRRRVTGGKFPFISLSNTEGITCPSQGAGGVLRPTLSIRNHDCLTPE
ncbi:hypothetical protein BJV78DRAFT_5550 [Lactifluus subvellereus]|nr:hypothetical protein BJV78DRAFT_5550 [Lactifluus subvellereus]